MEAPYPSRQRWRGVSSSEERNDATPSSHGNRTQVTVYSIRALPGIILLAYVDMTGWIGGSDGKDGDELATAIRERRM